MKAIELRSKSRDELSQTLLELSREQFNLRMQKGTGQLAKPSQVKAVRKDIARINTILSELARA
ncbi:50S ribosomal protein L29 [Methylomonas koyamae]|uniref:Large ribosomal subunit protein uL29 n=1 Tax=Methylomonas koyamae TaxID=702114 RepID=A0A177NZD1_9GAMM|nr:50S ribosomal protein L29 [Methylomonas koyamae]ATG91803.1 50S ribosomal protein L29 [Methylomonas koyamae]OAI12000.1 50S ribosomal protein L29 [Methylomonas koyamae]OAI23388.1 50S ribosomal protein L29 [Methylomonas koyamae]WNB75246.1 50S ribosomal protein L29 [Methylomonas koyamae]BBL60018.1 50S ribosomal protein L29 [Methylomonas koyamae]